MFLRKLANWYVFSNRKRSYRDPRCEQTFQRLFLEEVVGEFPSEKSVQLIPAVGVGRGTEQPNDFRKTSLTNWPG